MTSDLLREEYSAVCQQIGRCLSGLGALTTSNSPIIMESLTNTKRGVAEVSDLSSPSTDRFEQKGRNPGICADRMLLFCVGVEVMLC